MNDKELIALMALMMCSDPWPTGDDEDNEILVSLMVKEAAKRGYDSWIPAYYEMGK